MAKKKKHKKPKQTRWQQIKSWAQGFGGICAFVVILPDIDDGIHYLHNYIIELYNYIIK